jgi:integrase
LQEYDYRLKMLIRILDDAGLETHPEKVGEKEIAYLLGTALAEKSTKYRHHSIQILSRWMAVMAKNYSVSEMLLLWPPKVPKRTYLETDQVVHIMDSVTGLDFLIMHLGAQLGLRCTEIATIQTTDIDWGPTDEQSWIRVKGKGHMGGKVREIPFHPDTGAILRDWYVIRDEMVRKHRRAHPDIPVPQNIIVHNHCTLDEVRAYNPKSIGRRVKQISEKHNIRFSTHSLRRACATTLADAEIQLPVIADMLGDDIRTTMGYIQGTGKRMVKARRIQKEFEMKIRKMKEEGEENV